MSIPEDASEHCPLQVSYCSRECRGRAREIHRDSCGGRWGKPAAAEEGEGSRQATDHLVMMIHVQEALGWPMNISCLPYQGPG
jgi:hypothetical protein